MSDLNEGIERLRKSFNQMARDMGEPPEVIPKRAPGRFSFGFLVGVTLALAVIFLTGLGCYAAWMAVVG